MVAPWLKKIGEALKFSLSFKFIIGCSLTLLTTLSVTFYIFNERQEQLIIRQAEKLTLPAQHAFLKTLEEPPAGSQIFLVTAHPDSLLPTVLSRCTSVQDNKPVAGEPELSPTQQLLDQILSATAGQRLFLMESQKFTRDSALEFLDHLEYFLHQQIRSGSPVTINYSLLTETRKFLAANVSVRLALSHLFLNL